MGNGIRIRLGFIFVVFLFFFGVIFFRLIQLQCFRDPVLDDLAQKQFSKVARKTPLRAPLFDRNGEEFAISIPAVSVYARPKLIFQRTKTAKILAQYLGGSVSKWLHKLDREKSFVWIHRQLSEEQARQLTQLNLPGIFVESENKRLYPNGSVASALVGFTDIDGNGISGVELMLNKLLLEQGHKQKIARDGRGTPSYLGKEYVGLTDPKKGIRLTLDRRIQYIVEEELERAQDEFKAKAAIGIVVDPHTGEVFAMGQKPGFDANITHDMQSVHTTLKGISSLYEPGSVIKPLFAAEALQAGLLHSNSKINCERGKYAIGNQVIREAETDHVYGELSLAEVIRYSSNVGAVKVAQLLGTQRVKNLLEKFGLNERSGLGLPGEAFNAVKNEGDWTPLLLGTVGFGQGISVTPLQMVMGFASFANGGYRVKPKILLEEPDGVATKPENQVKRILSPESVRIIREILIGVTEGKNGTGVNARIEGVRVAGKTGTAQKYESGAGYNNKKYFSSFIGFLPADNPELLIGVMIDEPKFPYYASQTAAPIFKRIAERSLQALGRSPKNMVFREDAADRSQVGKPLFGGTPTQIPTLLVQPDGTFEMPNLLGLSMREVIRVLGGSGRELKMSGNGFLVNQDPPVGLKSKPRETIRLKFSEDG